MSNLGQRPNFGSRTEEVAVNNSSNQTYDTPKRIEAGAIWSRTASKSGKEFLSIRLKVEEVQNLLEKAKADNSDKVSLIAFTNDKGDNQSRPDYRIFEESNR